MWWKPNTKSSRCAILNSMSADTFKVGFSTGLTSPYGEVAKNQIQAATLAVEEINALGGVKGKEVEILIRDDEMSVEKADVLARELIEKEGVDMLAGTFSAASQLATNRVAKEHGIPFVSCSQSNQIGTKEHAGPLTFHEALTPYMTGLFATRWGIENFGKRWVSLVPDYQWGYESYESSHNALIAMGGEDLGLIKVPLGATVEQYVAVFDEILAKKPDALSVRNLGKDQENFVHAVMRTGLKKELPILLGISETMIINAVSLDDLVGLYWGVNFYWGLQDRIPSAKRFVESFRKRFDGALPTGYGGFAYAGVKELLLAFAGSDWKKGSYDGVRDFLEGRHYDHYKGQEWWRPCDHQAFQDFYILRFKGPEESTEKYDIAEIIDTVRWDLSIERTCEELGFSHTT